MRKLIISGPSTVSIVEEPDEPLLDTAIRIKSIYNGISHGTEMNFYRGTAPQLKYDIRDGLFLQKKESDSLYPIWHGYETVGTVVEAGKKAVNFKVGDIVWAGTCHADVCVCDTAEDKKPFFCERMPDGGDPEAGIFLALAGVAFDGYLTSGLMHGESAVVFGLGCIGLLTVQILSNAGINEIIAVDPIKKRRDLALGMGATTVVDPTEVSPAEFIIDQVMKGSGVDAAIETSGSWAALHESVRCCASGYGRVVALGFYQGQGSQLRLGEEFHHSTFYDIGASSILAINNRRDPAQGRGWDRIRIHRLLAKMLADKTIQTKQLLTCFYPFEQAEKAFQKIDKHPEDVIKVALKF